MDKVRIADALRKRLVRRLSFLIDSDADDLKKLSIGVLINLLFVCADEESVGGYNTSVFGVKDLIGSQLLWAQPATEEEKKVVVIQ